MQDQATGGAADDQYYAAAAGARLVTAMEPAGAAQSTAHAYRALPAVRSGQSLAGPCNAVQHPTPPLYATFLASPRQVGWVGWIVYLPQCSPICPSHPVVRGSALPWNCANLQRATGSTVLLSRIGRSVGQLAQQYRTDERTAGQKILHAGAAPTVWGELCVRFPDSSG